jgi:hypothetical protein
MQQIADWLQKLGLGQYAQRVAENDITFSILPDLTEQDLKEIGVSLGHRRQLLREIAYLGKTVGAPPLAPSVSAPQIAAPTVIPPGEAAGKRRHVTVMFCAGTGSPMSCFSCCDKAVECPERLGGLLRYYHRDGA